MNRRYVFPERISGGELKEIRRSLDMTQIEFAALTGVSKSTVERWESQDEISGPIVALVELLRRDTNIPEKMSVPERRGKLRLFYMFESMVCTIIDVDETQRTVRIKNYTDKPQFRAFGINTEPTFEDYEEFVESRCFPRTRDKMKLELARLGIPFYDPIMIIEKTQGRMSEDNFRLLLER